MTILQILQDGRESLQQSLENDSPETKALFKEAAELHRTREYLKAQEDGLKKFINLMFQEDKKLWAYETLETIAGEADKNFVGKVIGYTITPNDIFHLRLFDIKNRLLISTVDETTQLYFYPFKDTEAYFGYVSSFPNGNLYFQGVVIQHEYYYQTIDVVNDAFTRANGKG